MTNSVERDLVASWMGSVRGSEYGFLKAVVYALEQFEHKNNKPLSAMVAICNGKVFSGYKIVEGDRLPYAAPLKRILAKALSGCDLKFVDGKSKWKVAQNGGVNRDILDGLRVLVASDRTCSVRSDAFKEMFPVVKKTVSKSAIEIAQGRAALIRKWCAEAGFDRKDMAAMILNEPSI
jgi:hypothetical protein